MSSSLYDELRRMIDPMPLISVHEHQREDAHFRDVTLDFLLLNSYVGWTSPNKGAIKDRRGYLAGVRNHSYFVWMQRALSAIYGVGEITEKSWEEISGKIRQAHAADPNWHVEMLRKHGLYQKAIQDTFWRPGSDVGHPEMFAPTLRINAWVWCHHAEMKDHNGNGVESLCRWEDHFDDHLAAVERTVAAHKERGAVALKSAMAYERDINFKVVSRQEAARVHGKGA